MPYADQVDAERARTHVRALLDGGMTISQIQFASGVNRTAIRVLLGEFPNRKPSQQIRHNTEQRLLRTRLNRGVTIDGLVPSIGTRRRIQALVAIGYPQRYLAQRLGMTTGLLQFARQDLMRAAHAQAVMELYDELRDTTGPSSRARELARNRGWLGPLWWDDDTIDDPLYVPDGTATYRVRGVVVAADVDEIAVDRAMAGDMPPGLTSAETDTAVARLHGLGLNDTEIGQRLGLSHDAVLKRRQRSELGRTSEPVLLDDATLPRATRAQLMRRRGLTPDEIAARIGSSTRYIHRDLREAQ